MDFIIGIIIGALSGWIAGKIMDSKGGLIKNIILGLVGGFVGSFLFSLVGFETSGTIGTIITSVAGACVVIFIGRKLMK